MMNEKLNKFSIKIHQGQDEETRSKAQTNKISISYDQLTIVSHESSRFITSLQQNSLVNITTSQNNIKHKRSK